MYRIETAVKPSSVGVCLYVDVEQRRRRKGEAEAHRGRSPPRRSVPGFCATVSYDPQLIQYSTAAYIYNIYVYMYMLPIACGNRRM